MTLYSIFITMLLSSCSGDSNLQVPNPSEPPQKKRRPPVLRPIEDDPKLPRVLVIGDSISMGYTLGTRELLTDRANVHRPPTNCGPTTRGLDQIDDWLGSSHWDVIHFNWGLHDLKYMGPNGENLADPKAADSRQQVPIEQYEKNLERLVERLKKTKASLIWGSTTPVPTGAKGRVPGDSAKYNVIALRVMKKHEVVVNDLYAFAKPHTAKIQRRADVHFTSDGYEQLARRVAAAILQQLKQRPRAKKRPSNPVADQCENH